MSRVLVVQTDNRPELDYLLLTQKVIKKTCNTLNYEYLFANLDMKKYENIHPATAKIYVINEILNNSTNNILVFLDSDAWVQDIFGLEKLIELLSSNDNKNGCFSRDPYDNGSTFINSGSFIIKNNSFIKNIYSEIINLLENKEIYSCYKNFWPYDQFFISNIIFKNKDSFYIFVPEILNTPDGKILRHNWWKNEKMYEDLNILMDNDEYNIISSIDFNNYFDKENFTSIFYFDNDFFDDILNDDSFYYNNELENKKFLWQSDKIFFLKNGKMNAFGEGKYIFEKINNFYENNDLNDYKILCDIKENFEIFHIVHSYFGGKLHTIFFDKEFHKFVSIRRGDNEKVIGLIISE